MTGRTILCINDHPSALDADRTEQLIATLPEWRRREALSIRHLQGRRECALAYIELQRALRLAFGIDDTSPFAYGAHGKPSLARHPGIHFSISHCRQAVGCLLSNRPCGLDIERIRPVNPALIRYTMNPGEAQAIHSAPSPELMFARLWTRKEAVLKLLGTGITDSLHHVLDPENLASIRLRTIDNPLQGYVLTTAIA